MKLLFWTQKCQNHVYLGSGEKAHSISCTDQTEEQNTLWLQLILTSPSVKLALLNLQCAQKEHEEAAIQNAKAFFF